MKRILICGYYGYDNCGDDAILQSILGQLKQRCGDTPVTVIANSPEKIEKEYGILAIPRYDMKGIWKALDSTEVLLFGGGGLLQDITSSRSLYYYLSILKMAQIRKVKTMIYANGMGPLLRPLNRWCTKKCLNKADVITVRDEDSAKLLKEIGVNKRKILVTADPVFGLSEDLEDPFDGKDTSWMPEGAYAVITVRNWKETDSLIIKEMTKFCERFEEKQGIRALLIPMQYDWDVDISREIKNKIKGKAYLPDRPLTVDEIRYLISRAEFVVGMRLHSLIFAMLHQVPCIAVSYDPKVEGFMKQVDQPYIVQVDQIDEKQLWEMYNSILVDSINIKQRIKNQLTVLKAEAKKNTNLLIQLMFL